MQDRILMNIVIWGVIFIVGLLDNYFELDGKLFLILIFYDILKKDFQDNLADYNHPNQNR